MQARIQTGNSVQKCCSLISQTANLLFFRKICKDLSFYVFRSRDHSIRFAYSAMSINSRFE